MMPVKITDRALAEISQTFQHKNIPDGFGLRIGVRGAGCAGVSYVIGFDQPSEEDQVFNLEGVEVMIARKDYMHLIGKAVDFYEGDDARGFTFVDEEDTQ